TTTRFATIVALIVGRSSTRIDPRLPGLHAPRWGSRLASCRSGSSGRSPRNGIVEVADRQASFDLAARAGLRWVNDETPGHRRIRRGKGFSYVDQDGQTVSDDDRRWIESLVIPPAWTDVWISTDRRGHLLATGKDDADRKQYIYHPDWEEARDAAKFDRMGEFAERLPVLRQRVEEDLGGTGLAKDKVIALSVA